MAIYDEMADSVAAEYRLFLLALAGLYQQLRAPGVEPSPRAVANLHRDALVLAHTFSGIALLKLNDYAQQIDEDGSQSFVERKRVVQSLIWNMLVENVQQVVKLARTGIVDYGKVLRQASGTFGLLIQSRAGIIDYKVTDTSGRNWSAETLMRVVVRDFAYQAWLDKQFEGMTKDGVDLVEASDGTVFSLAGTMGHPSLADVRETIFHPNSNKTVAPYVSP